MPKTAIIVTAAILGLLATSPSAMAKEYQVRMLNKGAAGTMVFEPAFVKIAPGDTVRFVPTDRGHNAEAMLKMVPNDAAFFKGKINEELVVPFTVPGLYAYKCLPHLGLGMVGLIEVKAATNKPMVMAAAAQLPGLARTRMTALLRLAR